MRDRSNSEDSSVKTVFYDFIAPFFLIIFIIIYTGLFLAMDSGWIRGISLVLLAAALIVSKKHQEKFIVALISIFTVIMLYYSVKEIPAWKARVSGAQVGTDTVWSRDEGFVDSLIYTVVHDKRCIVENEGWYNKYIEVMAADIQIMDELNHKVLNDESALANGFKKVGWMHIDNNFNLLSEEANARFEEGEEVYLYINPVGLSEADTLLVWNDQKGNIYVKPCDTEVQ